MYEVFRYKGNGEPRDERYAKPIRFLEPDDYSSFGYGGSTFVRSAYNRGWLTVLELEDTEGRGKVSTHLSEKDVDDLITVLSYIKKVYNDDKQKHKR